MRHWAAFIWLDDKSHHHGRGDRRWKRRLCDYNDRLIIGPDEWPAVKAADRSRGKDGLIVRRVAFEPLDLGEQEPDTRLSGWVLAVVLPRFAAARAGDGDDLLGRLVVAHAAEHRLPVRVVDHHQHEYADPQRRGGPARVRRRLMYAMAANLVTCSAPGCTQPGTVTVIRVEPHSAPAPGQTAAHEHTAGLVDYCDRCAERNGIPLELRAVCGQQPAWNEGGDPPTNPTEARP